MINTGRAVADGFAAGDAVTCGVDEIAAVDDIGSLAPVGDDAVDEDAVNDGADDGDGAVVVEPLLAVAAASRGTTSLERGSGVPHPATRQPTSTAEIIGHRHKLFTCTTTITDFS